ncbi:Isy1-like splicing factor [Radiomyces spectabilis]|uniref:Isy1-like splicing factor n=1 Tax=Radiomyces spectabilis TaxID=64574 RepID=UPI00221F2C1B|nr:Isy1-like splicing factor [Radiomyces spectabilis]KAI8393686.1 Isy1-like splicing factor [Radiomyces spectabilis]
MARNEEKAQSMLYRFREAQAAELGGISRRQKRPGAASSVNNIGECEKWRRDVLQEISRKVSKIQDTSLSDYQVRDLNDEINRLMREKYYWERRIRELGGAVYSRAPKMIDAEGKEVPGHRGYKYFGRAKDLPGVRELFETEAAEPVSRTRAEIYRNIDADYYGYRDEEDGLILEYEKQREPELVERALNRPDEEPEEEAGEAETDQKSQAKDKADHQPMDLDKDVVDVPVPSQEDVEKYLVERRRQELLEKYVSDDLKHITEETKELTGMS